MSNTKLKTLHPMLVLNHLLGIWRALSIVFAILLTIEYSDSAARQGADLKQDCCKDAAKKPRAAPQHCSNDRLPKCQF
ncbi:hypothetical protein [Herpetosiphon geysericola]|uniref:hypothetical protein n=1 Tax=Herpetosiphon geysericola TaxID=70996 RepID=UPI00128ED64C|nr:hypothetical protein [Herpetosiphon geysericola]